MGMRSRHHGTCRIGALKPQVARTASWNLWRLWPLAWDAACYFVGGFSPAEFLFEVPLSGVVTV